MPQQQDVRRAGCKINLTLRLTGLRDDGYHLLDSIFWPIDTPHDTLTFSYGTCPDSGTAPNTGSNIGTERALRLSCNLQDIDLQNNTLTKAYEAFLREGGQLPQEMGTVQVHLHKGIPHGAGLGGGSSDAATLLLWCNEKAKEPLNPETLHKAALSVGADVPFFLQNVPARVQGIGEIISPLPQPWPKAYVLLLCPNIYISTPWAYKKFDEEKNETFSKNMLTKTAFDYRTLFTGAGHETVAHNGHKGHKEETKGHRPESLNDFESIVFAAHPTLAKLKQDLLKNGAFLASLSGSGSSLIGLFSSEQEAQRAAKQFQHAQCKVFIAAL